MIVKVSFLVAASFAAYAFSQINSNSIRKQTTLDELHDGALMESGKVDEKDEENENYDDEDKENKLRGIKVWKNAREDEKLIISDLASEIEQRKVYLQGKLLELYGLKEEKQYLAKLQTHLEQKSEEINILNVTLASLQCEKDSLEEETKQGALAKKKLEVAKKMIVETERKMVVNARRVKGRVSMIEDRVCGFQGDESSPRDALIEQKLKAVRSLELEAGKTKRRNKELQLEKRTLTVTLVAAQDKIAVLSQVTEDQVMDKIEDQISALRHNNEELSRQIEKLHKDRFEMVEELVYQRWLNICLKFEAQNKDNPPTQNSKNNNLNNNNALTNSDEKIKTPTSYPSSSYSFSSLTSSTESDQVGTTTFRSSSTESRQNSSRKSSSFMRRVTRWRSGHKDDSIVTSLAEKRKSPTSTSGLVRRFSTSMVPESSSSINNGLDENVIATSPFVKNKEQYCFAKSSEKLSCNTLRVRRVSFSDHLVKKDGDDDDDDDDDVTSIRPVDRVLGHQSDKKSSHKLNSTGFEGKENSEEKSESGVNGVSTEDKRLENIDGDVIKNEMIGGSKENKIEEDQLVQYLFALLGFLLFIFLAYILHTTTRFLKT